MAENYLKYDRKSFEKEITEISESLDLKIGDFTEKQGRQRIEERVYEITTQNPQVRILIYSSIDPRNGQCREVGGDAVRVNFYCSLNGKYYYKKFKKHQRITTLYKNLKKSISEAKTFADGEDIKRWLYAVTKNN